MDLSRKFGILEQPISLIYPGQRRRLAAMTFNAAAPGRVHFPFKDCDRWPLEITSS